MKFDWENIYNGVSGNSTKTYRAKVIGGWVLLNENHDFGTCERSISESMVFIPDPEHKWEID